MPKIFRFVKLRVSMAFWSNDFDDDYRRSEVLILLKNAEQKEEGIKRKATKNAIVYRHNCDAMTINRFTGNTL